MSREDFSKYPAEKRPWFSFYEELVERAFVNAQARSEARQQTEILSRAA